MRGMGSPEELKRLRDEAPADPLLHAFGDAEMVDREVVIQPGREGDIWVFGPAGTPMIYENGTWTELSETC